MRKGCTQEGGLWLCRKRKGCKTAGNKYENGNCTNACTLPSFGFLLAMVTARQRKASASTKMNSRRLRVCCLLTEPFISGGILKDFKKQCLVRSRRRIVKEAINTLQTCAIYLLTFFINPTNQAISYARLTIHSSFYYIVHYPHI